MLNKLKELRESREEGFTLIELLVVIVIIGVLAAIALPIFLNQQKAAAQAAVKSDVRNAVTAVATALVKTPTATDTATVTPIATAVSGSPKSDGVTLTVARTATFAASNASVTTAGLPGWDSYVINGTTTADSGYFYTFVSTTGKYTEKG